jgi:hypothetical protein
MRQANVQQGSDLGSELTIPQTTNTYLIMIRLRLICNGKTYCTYIPKQVKKCDKQFSSLSLFDKNLKI